MNWRYKLLILLAGSVLGLAGVEARAQNTNAFRIVKVKTNSVPRTNILVTVVPPVVVLAVTNEIKEATPPGQKFTNSVEMVLLQVGGFWAGEYDVTQKEYREVMHSNPSAFAGDKRPVDSVNYQDALDFCRKLTARDVKELKLPKGYYYTLPSEDEWVSLMADAPLSTAVTSLDGTTRSGTSPVGTLAPNRLGLYDTRGNVSEFCLADDSKPYRVLKGGSWADFVDVNLRPDFRWYCKPDETKNTFGFRCVLKKG